MPTKENARIVANKLIHILTSVHTVETPSKKWIKELIKPVGAKRRFQNDFGRHTVTTIF